MADETIEIPITTDASKFVRETARATNGLLALEKAQIAVGVATQAASAVWERVVRVQVDAVRELDRVSRSASISSRTVAGLRLAAQELGQELDSVVPVDLADKLQEVREGNKTWIDDFKILGLEARDFEEVGWDVTASLGLIVEAMGNVDDKQKAAGASSRLLSTAGENLFAVFGDGTRTLEQYAQKAERIGLGTKEAQENAREMAAAMSDLSLAVEQATAEIGDLVVESGALELVEDFARGLVFAFKEGGEAIEAFMDTPIPRLYAGLYELSTKVLAPFVKQSTTVAEELKKLDVLRFNFAGRSALEEQSQGYLFLIDQFRQGAKAAEEAAKKTGTTVKEEAEEIKDYSREMAEFESRVNQIMWAEAEAYQAQLAAEQAAREQAAADELARLEEAGAARREAAMEAIRLAEEMRASQIAAQESVVANAQAAAGSIVSLAQGTQGRMRGVLIAVATAERALAVARTLFQVGPAYAQGVSAAPPPAGFILGGANAAAVLAQAAATAAAPLPKFHRGRAMQAGPDEVPAVLHRTEAVLTAEAVQALNAGRGGGGSEPAIVVLDHVSVGRAVTRALRDPRSEVYDAVRRDLPGHSRRRR